jgi:glycosidase
MPRIQISYQPLTAGSHVVGIAGDFNAWEIVDLNESGGIHTITLELDSGKYRYKLIVDGVWMADPANPLCEPDPFGGLNSILIAEQEDRPDFTWQQVFADPSLLDERKERYLDVVRRSQDSYELRFSWYPGMDVEVFALVDQTRISMRYLGRDRNREVWHCVIRHAEPRISMLIMVCQADESMYYGSFGFAGKIGDTHPINISLVDLETFSVPDWVGQGIIYQIFVDRFHNGDPSNDPDFSEWYYADCKTAPKPHATLAPNREYYHLVSDWNDISGLTQSPWLEEGKPDWWSFYGGDIEGVRQKLDYLADLGVTIIYFNPLWQAKSNHKYDAADFRRVDPHFADTAKMIEFMREARNHGMKVILDVAFNHTGETFWAFRDCVEKGDKSPYWNWYDWYKWPLPKPLPPDFKPRDYYQCWWGIKDMPDLNFDLSRPHPAENYIHDVRKAVPNAALVDYILQSVTWWLRDIGIDGFRLDVPDEVPFWFWQLFRKHVRSVKPDAWLVGEIWQNAQGWVNHRYFDSVMNYAYFKNPVLGLFILRNMDVRSFRARMEEGLAQYPFHAISAMMNLIGSHDTWRVLELAKGDIQLLKQALFFQMAWLGAPHIYYGDEIAMLGSRDPDNRRPFNWDWEKDPDAADLRACYQKLIAFRKLNPVLALGDARFLDAEPNLLCFQRYDDHNCVTVVINPDNVTHELLLDTEPLIDLSLGDILVRQAHVMLAGHSAFVAPDVRPVPVLDS